MAGLVIERVYVASKPGSILFSRKKIGAKSWRSRHWKLSTLTIVASQQDNSSASPAAEAAQDLELDEEAKAVTLSIEKLAKNKRKITASISMGCIPLETVWNVLTDYERLADFIPGLASSQILEKRQDGAQLLQVGEQDLALGVKVRARGVVEVTEVPLELLVNGCRRDIAFDMVEGDFKLFRGIWRIEELEDEDATRSTVLHYNLEVQPKVWIPVALIEGRLRKEVSNNLISVRERAELTL